MQSSKRMMKRLPRYRQNGMMQKKKKKKNASLEKFSTYFTDHKEKKVRKKISKTFVLNKYITWPNLILTMEKKTTTILQQ